MTKGSFCPTGAEMVSAQVSVPVLFEQLAELGVSAKTCAGGFDVIVAGCFTDTDCVAGEI
jgi:hypothetical protein